MTKRLYIIILFLSSILISCSQLNSDNDTTGLYSNAEKILISSENESSLSFEITLFSKNKIKQYEYLGLEGTNIDNLDVEMTDNTIDKIKNHKYKDYYTTVLIITITPEQQFNREIEINKLVLNINGESNKVEFTTPIIHAFEGGNVFTDDLLPYVMTNEMTSMSIKNNDEFLYQFEAKKDLQIENIYAKDFLTPSISKMNIGGNIVEDEIQYPISIPANTMVELALQFNGNEPTINELNYISTNLFFEYIAEGNPEKQTNGVVVFLNPIYPILDDLNKVENYIDTYIYNE